MIKLSTSACIEASTDTVWALLANLENIHAWVEPIISSHCTGEKSRGIGATRVCNLSGGISVTEEWTAWDEGRSFEYIASGMPLVKRATNRWVLHPHGNQTLVVSHAEITLKGGALAKLLEPAMRRAIKTMGPRSLAAFKYLVEHGVPYQGKHNELALAPVAC